MATIRVSRPNPLVVLGVGEFVTVSGTQATFVVLPWFVLQEYGSGRYVGLVLGLSLAGVALSGLFAGHAVVILGPRICMLGSEGLRGVLTGLIPLLQVLGLLSVPALAVLVLLGGLCYNPYVTAQRTIIPEIVGEDDPRVGGMNALLQGCQRAGGVAGPVVAGILYASFGSLAALWFDACTFFASMIILMTGLPRLVPIGRKPAVTLRTAFSYLMRSRHLRTLVLGLAVGSIAFQGIFVLLPVAVDRSLEADAVVLATILGAFGGGAALGSVGAWFALRRWSRDLVAFVSICVQILLLFTLPVWLSEALLVAVFFMIGVANPFAIGPIFAYLSTAVPHDMVPYVVSIGVTLITCAGAVGPLVVGSLLDVMAVAGVAGIVAAVSLIGNGAAAAVFWRLFVLGRSESSS